MKSIAIALIALGLLSGTASAHSAKVFTDLGKTAPRGADVSDTVSHSAGVFRTLQKNAP